MNCTEIREQLPDVASGACEASPEVHAHVAHCGGCADTLNALRETMNLLDEWEAPKPSPFFDVRLQARLREEREKEQKSWLAWLRKPAFGIAATVLLAVGVGLFQGGDDLKSSPQQPTAHIMAKTGTAVGDLQFLEKNSDMLQDFDALDVLDNTPNDNAQQLN